jgi:hypothetical protein
MSGSDFVAMEAAISMKQGLQFVGFKHAEKDSRTHAKPVFEEDAAGGEIKMTV